MAFFSTDIELLPSNRYDAGVDKWNAVYLGLKQDLIKEYGSAGKAPKTGNNMPAVPYNVAVAISVQFAIELSAIICRFIAEADDPLLVPEDFVKKANREVFADLSRFYSGMDPESGKVFPPARFSPAIAWWERFSGGGDDTRRAMAIEWLANDVCRSNYQSFPNPGELKNPVIQRMFEPNWRLVPGRGGDNAEPVVVCTREDTDPERQWLRPAVRAYQGLIWNAYELFSLSAGGPVKPLNVYGAELFLSRVYASTQWLAIRIPSISSSDIFTYTAARTSEVITQAAGVATDGLNWAVKTAAGAANEAIGTLDIFTWLVLGSVGAVYLAIA